MLSIGRRIMLRFAIVLTTCFLVGSSAHAQQTIGELFGFCEAYERGARRSGISPPPLFPVPARCRSLEMVIPR